ncbi:MAG TPA: amylo-alpha-1,6-glucosidase [Candidatus Cloacimonadota bacterium]|nr:amylo-alpha-1,6-glucosidase [Candidatus Cloacimonadota bacterium]HQL15499.1 amylo-alpha-1,6-glucosidase [Candidatus Cloacimonadota bacterium]
MNNYFMETHHHEWILTNRLGGYALGTGNLINQRKYHGLLIAGDENFQRNHLVSTMEEKVEWRGDEFYLDSNNYSNCIFPEGFLHLVKPWLRPYPIFLYSALPHQNDILIKKEIMMDADTNTVLIKYTNLGHHKLHFKLLPKFTLINHHEINPPGSLDYEEISTTIENKAHYSTFSAKRISNGIEVYGASQKGEFIPNRLVYYNVFYPWEVMNGYPGIGDQIALFELNFELAVGEATILLFSDRKLTKIDSLIERIVKRYQRLPLPHDYPCFPDKDDTLLSKLDFNDSYLFNRKEYLKILEFMLQDFLSNDDIVAGYPWYGAWGRNTMFVVNALLHSKGKLSTAEAILRKYSLYIRNGLIPNTLPESGREGNYDSLDATFWYIILMYKLGKKKNSITYWKQAVNLAEQILQGILDNRTLPFNIREDGLLNLQPEFAHSTWMDVRIDGKAVTPRDGAPIEINALFYNAICSYEAMVNMHNAKSTRPLSVNQEFLALRDKIAASFPKFWLGDYPADRLIGDEPVREFRPNGLIAAALPWQLFTKEQLDKLFQKAFKELYTFYGIRTLSPSDIKYKKKYYGPQAERDKAFHNGSVWAWLMGPFCGTYLKAYQDTKSKREIIQNLSDFIGVFRNSIMRGHIASVAEVWDGDFPHFPKGAPAMAWSVAAIYNIETFIEKLQGESV